MSRLPPQMVRRFEQVRQHLIDDGALPSNALQLACPETAADVVPRLIRAGADALSLTTALAEVFDMPIYTEDHDGLAEYAADRSWARAARGLFVADPFASCHLLRNPHLELNSKQLHQGVYKIGLIPLPNTQDAEVDPDPSSSPEAEQILHEWLSLAVRQNASDLHITPRDNEFVEIKVRSNGMLLTLREERIASEKCHYRLISNTLLTLSGNQHGVYNTPKDGNLEINLHGQVFFIRLSMCPVTIGRRVWGSFTLRIAGGYQRTVQTLEQLSLEPRVTESLHRIAAMNSGLFLLTGPTGTGKTTTFYAVIMEVLRRSGNQTSIKTLEDPIEVQLPGIDQIQINNDLGMNYASGLRALLRADPDVILIGEIRDEETAQLACRASLTGHLVLSTLHTRNSLGAVERLRNLGVNTHLIADTLAAVSAQRLVRQVCQDCAGRGLDDASQLATRLLQLPPAEWTVAGRGCPACHHSGYRGRLCVAEILNVDADIAEQIAANANIRQLYRTAYARGFVGLWGQATRLVEAGRTTWAECLRVLPAPSTEPDLSGPLFPQPVTEILNS